MTDKPAGAEVQWWLASLDQHGNPTLSDGAHSNRAEVEKAAYLIARLRLGTGRRYACARVEITPIEAQAHGANEDAIRALHSIGLAP